MSRVRSFAAVLVAAVLALPGSARAQTTDPHLRALLDTIEPATPGVTLTIRNAPPAPPEFTLRNTSGKQLELTGYDFEPFVRIGPGGVSANRRSRTYYVTQDPTGTGRAPDEAKPGATPVWVPITPQPEWRWFEGRAVWRQPIPAAIVSADKEATLGPWAVSGTLGGARITFSGRMIYKPIFGEARARLLGVSPAVSGLTVQVLHGPIPGLIATSSSEQLIEIQGRDGLPFARISRIGVDVNADSATARDDPRLAPPGARGWRHIQDTRVLSWLERRAAFTGEDPPGDPRKKAELVRWSVPMKVGSAPAEIRGVTEWTPFATTSPGENKSSAPLYAFALGAVVAIFVAAIIIRRRRKTA